MKKKNKTEETRRNPFLAVRIYLEVEIELNTNVLKCLNVSSTKGKVGTICGIN